MTPPQWIVEESDRRIRAATEAYLSIPAEYRFMSLERYIELYLNNLPPLTWNSNGT